MYLESKQQILCYTAVVPFKTVLDSRSKSGTSLFPFSDRNGAKTIPFRAAHIHVYGRFIQESTHPPSRDKNNLTELMFFESTLTAHNPLFYAHINFDVINLQWTILLVNKNKMIGMLLNIVYLQVHKNIYKPRPDVELLVR